jgi:proteasome lid subunit RPN8/RPN11
MFWAGLPWKALIDVAKSKTKTESSVTVSISAEVARQIRQHARSSMHAEVCGVLIGPRGGADVQITACIEGENAAQAGTHVTFTQETWEHVYKIKDAQFPEERIVGWYHSHPGFGIFLSDHDAFIHKNFSSTDQIAWVFDPHSDEEGCFGWNDGRLERLRSIRVKDSRGGEPVRMDEGGERPTAVSRSGNQHGVSVSPDASFAAPPASEFDNFDSGVPRRGIDLPIAVLSVIAAFLVGGLIARFVFPREVLRCVILDPVTRKALHVYECVEGPAPAPDPANAGPRDSDGKR